MQRLIVTSATYRQSSKIMSELLKKDAENRAAYAGHTLGELPLPQLDH